MASTYGCISVCLYRNLLIIRPHWFLGWLIYLLGLDLFHEIPTEKLRSVEQVGKLFGYGKIEVTFVSNDLKIQKILLYLKEYEQFINQVKAIV